MCCLLLTYGPFMVVYHSTNLVEERAFSACFGAGFNYAVTQLIKIFMIATFLPSLEDSTAFEFLPETMTTLANVIDVIGVTYALNRSSLSKFDQSLRILCVALGWTGAQSLASYLIPLWIGARGPEFKWDYIQMGVTSNVSLLLMVGFTGMCWLRTRTDLELPARPLVTGSLAAASALPSVTRYLSIGMGLSVWHIQGLRLAVALFITLLAYRFTSRYASNIRAKVHKSKKPKST